MGELVILVPGVPPPGLMPNRMKGEHWAKYNRLRQEQKADAKYQTQALFNGHGSPLPADACPEVRVRVTWPKKRASADLDNLMAGIKGLCDGVFLALDRDDRDIRSLCITQVRAEPDDEAGSVEFVLLWDD